MKARRAFITVTIIFFIVFLAGCEANHVFSEGPGTIPTVSGNTGIPVDRQIKLVDSGPVHGGTLTLGTTPIDSLHPFETSSRYVNYIFLFIYDPLFIQSSENNFEPWLIESYSHEGYVVWNFKLRQNVYFHNGRGLTSYDVRYTIRQLKKSNSPFYERAIVDNIKDFNIISSSQFEITLDKPDRAFIKKLVFPILPQNYEEEEYPVGTGPYCFERMTENELRLVKNDKWWHGETYIDEVIFKVYDEDKMLDAFQNNEIDVAFIKNVDFSRYRYRTDIDFRIYLSNESHFLYVNPQSIFGQSNRQTALFRYVAYRLHELNLGQVQYYELYSEEPIDVEGFRNELVRSGLSYDEKKNVFTLNGKTLDKILICVPKQDLPKLHTANFLVNILSDAGIQAEIVTVGKSNYKREIRSGKYDLSPVSDELKPWEELSDTLQRIQQDLGNGREDNFILPLYRNQQAVLFKNTIRGEKNANYWNPYQGFYSWYKPVFNEGSKNNNRQ
ncbi:peptide ABC transporter subbstrate-binding protein [Thermoclostridium stercorarium subsp. leptospartum DSM 9219]|uniref:Peptide ABC transporter subbstrate-binding protein n=1 Tax=Thermoclostridium stercorarium subsp. leptospartum DSM 9219 TaxID=1346611 RepID=A0A1B1YML8_THEST|nr:ABC transporter substrate-binding protein [Thermoclostridium stercorarium]ANX01982.1 peptide ABC transporter subbstrate-binding protein [Thermoclostridium stercorarium subsp. leptospartum DSM 9219]